MARPLAVILALVALIAGLVGGYFLRPIIGDAPAYEPSARQSKHLSGGTPADTPAESDPSAASLSSAIARASSQPKVASSSPGPQSAESLESLIARTLDALPRPSPLPVGDGVISGRVLLENGSPLPGVAIRLTAMRGEKNDFGLWRSDDPDFSASALDKARNALARVGSERANSFLTVSDSGGAFSVSGLPPLQFELAARLPGYTISYKSGSSDWYTPPVSAGCFVELTATASVTVKINVLLPDGSQPARAVVRTGFGGDDTSFAWSPTVDDTDLPPGVHQFQADVISPDGADYSTPVPVIADLLSAQSPPVITLRLRESRSVKGFFINPSRRKNLSATLIRFEADREPAEDDFRDAPGVLSEAYGGPAYYSATRFDYRFADLSPGKYALAAFDDGGLAAARRITVTSGTVRANLEIPVAPQGEFLKVTVIGSDPLVQVGLVFRMVRARSGTADHDSVAHYAQPDGSWRVRCIVPKFGEGEGWHLQAESPACGVVELPLGSARVSGNMEVRFPAPATLSAHLIGAENPQAADGLTLYLYRHSLIGTVDAVADTHRRGLSGGWSFGGLSPGEYEARLHSTRFSGAVWKTTLRLQPGENDLSVPALKLYSLDLTGCGQDWTRYSISGGGIRQTAGPGPEGCIRFAGLPAGEYLVDEYQRGTGSLHNYMKVTLPGPDRMEFKGEPSNVMDLSVDGQLVSEFYASGLSHRDLLLSCDGVPFRGDVDATERLARGGSAPLRLVVEHDGKQSIVWFPADMMKQALQNGHASVEPGGFR
jgi:hypothetical protein